jgi:hypothetical protein
LVVCLVVCLAVCLFVWLFGWLVVCLFVCLFVSVRFLCAFEVLCPPPFRDRYAGQRLHRHPTSHVTCRFRNISSAHSPSPRISLSSRYPDQRLHRHPIGQLSSSEPIGNGKNHSPGLLAVEALCRWVVDTSATARARTSAAESVVSTTVEAPSAAAGTTLARCGYCSAECEVSHRFQGDAVRCTQCRASGIEWKQAWLTTVRTS